VNRDTTLIDVRPMIRAISDDLAGHMETPRIARKFHLTMARVIAETCARLRSQTGLTTVVLSGGVMMNGLLVEEASRLLEAEQFRVCRHRLVPANDGGI